MVKRDFRTINDWATNRPVEKRIPYLKTTQDWLAEFAADPEWWRMTIGTTSGTALATTTLWGSRSMPDPNGIDPNTGYAFPSHIELSFAKQFFMNPSAGRTVCPEGYDTITIELRPRVIPTWDFDKRLAIFPINSIDRIQRSSYVIPLEPW